ncbi:hypothetical protein [Chelativorans alearense]|uniref:hypothetical protein n=1 Tax=Chelativorans alearense TaxID=2681495 RepID=UPI0013D23AB9|nr:hypothetical protein [Chelativorans alearense]
MKSKMILAAATMAALVAGCAAVQTAMEYNPTVHQVAMPDDTYRVFEHPKGDRIMTTASLGRATGQSLTRGITLGIVAPETPEQLHEAAARKYLDDTGREDCRIIRGYLLGQPQYEFFFECH